MRWRWSFRPSAKSPWLGSVLGVCAEATLAAAFNSKTDRAIKALIKANVLSERQKRWSSRSLGSDYYYFLKQGITAGNWWKFILRLSEWVRSLFFLFSLSALFQVQMFETILAQKRAVLLGDKCNQKSKLWFQHHPSEGGGNPKESRQLNSSQDPDGSIPLLLVGKLS